MKVSPLLHIMRVSSRLSMSPAKAIALTATVVAIAIILLAANFITTYAQQAAAATNTDQPTSSNSEPNTIKRKGQLQSTATRRLGNSGYE